MAQHLYTYINPLSEKHLRLALEVFSRDGIIAYPTDVNWAVGCDASNVKAIKRIQQLKSHHPKEQPFSLLCDSLSMVAQIALVEQPTYRFLRKILPGPYTILLPSNRSLPKLINDKRKSVGIRIPQCPLLLGLIAVLQKPILTSSLSSVEEPLRWGYEVDAHFGHQLDLILDLGEEVIPGETSIVDFSSGEPHVVRVGIGDVSMFD